ncbi:hypothetical protein Glove_168g165 [Diversispora epigaea]|uniref:Uncharacterized protein n=1 Tax=Diversispora epigaea TaxID=1348612 RepID=A0A397ITL2_9GLOM|nr:hypothetical protein Glove_168g165 [Diversispora epigaea]
MFIFHNYVDLQIPIKDTSNSNLYLNKTIYQNVDYSSRLELIHKYKNVDKSSRLDNYYSHFVSSVEVVFFWANERSNDNDGDDDGNDDSVEDNQGPSSNLIQPDIINEPLTEDPSPTINIDQLSMQKRFNNWKMNLRQDLLI